MDDRAALAAADATMARFIETVQRLDGPAFLEVLAPSVRLRSPISSNVRFEGLDAVAEVVAAYFDLLDEIEDVEDIGTATTRALFYRARTRNDVFDAAILVRLDDGARVTEMTMFVRPLPGLTALTAQLTPRLAASRGRLRGLALAVMTRPMAMLTARADSLGVRLVQPRSTHWTQ